MSFEKRKAIKKFVEDLKNLIWLKQFIHNGLHRQFYSKKGRNSSTGSILRGFKQGNGKKQVGRFH